MTVKDSNLIVVAPRLSASLAVWGIFAVAMLMVFAAETLHRLVGKPVEQIPGWTSAEYVERASKVKLDRDVVFLGDSRVGWGVAEKSITDEFRKLGAQDVSAVNLGLPGTSIENEIDFLRLQWAGRSANGGTMVIHYSPASWYSFKGTITSPTDGGQGAKETAIDRAFRSIITTNPSLFKQDIKLVIHQGIKPHNSNCYWGSRTVFAEGFVNGTLVCNDGLPFDKAKKQLDYYRSILTSGEFKGPATAQRKVSLLKKIRQLQADGWRVVIVRLPLGPRMRQIDESIATNLRGAIVADELGVPFIDYPTSPAAADFITQDESHLTPDSARRIAPILAADLMQILKTLPPVVRH